MLAIPTGLRTYVICCISMFWWEANTIGDYVLFFDAIRQRPQLLSQIKDCPKAMHLKIFKVMFEVDIYLK